MQHNHLHLIVEADDRFALLSGVKGLVMRIAYHVNRLLFRRGRFWADRWHGRALATPRAVRNALVYVLNNLRKHVTGARGMDTHSSAPWFGGWKDVTLRRDWGMPPVARARTWLARVGWLRHGRERQRRLGAEHQAGPDGGRARAMTHRGL